jgi:putative ATPase
MASLFDKPRPAGSEPLAAALRPQNLDEIIGQDALVAPGSVLRRRVEAKRLGSMVLYGPPGTGKTSIARAVGKELGKAFRPLHATRATVKDIRAIADEAKESEILIFVDEVHRFSKTQADDLLAITEDGLADFIGATTENPFHALPKALISRSTILKVEPISAEAMTKVIGRGIDHLKSHRGIELILDESHLDVIAGRSGGDARRALTTLESLAVGHAEGAPVTVTKAMLEDAYQAAVISYDRDGDSHYDHLSSYQKSLRGSDPDAAFYWLASMIHAGEDPRIIARRLVVTASEDVGLADNTALQTAIAAAQAVEMIGLPEAGINLAHATLHVARSPKSNSACRGLQLALQAVKNEPPRPVPMHLRDAHYKGAKELGHTGYKFPHDDPRGWVEQEYVPDVPKGRFYQSDARDTPTFEQRADAIWEQITKTPSKRRF